MIDRLGRKIDYLRISVTDRCNLRCKYCMPEGIPTVPMEQILTFEEIGTIAEEAAALGFRHIKLTGGEPLVRKELHALVKILKDVPGIEKVTLTTNGILLERFLPDLIASGLDAVNISLDTTDPAMYKEITGFDGADAVISAVHAACESGIRVKVNAVSLRLGDQNLRDLIRIARDNPVDVRFIEMMPIGYGKEFETLDHRVLFDKLTKAYPGMEADDRQHGYGPAVYYRIPGFMGSVGLISAIHGKFCNSCNRVRLTSMGYLKTCLCYDQGTDLREVLRSALPKEQRREEIRTRIREAVLWKPGEHCFDKPEEITENAGMNAIGG